jgi:hypothetical protein
MKNREAKIDLDNLENNGDGYDLGEFLNYFDIALGLIAMIGSVIFFFYLRKVAIRFANMLPAEV